MALTLLLAGWRVCQRANLRNLRTEIVLKDVNDVAFWFSFCFPVAPFQQRETGKRTIPVAHQTQTRQISLFPKRRGFGERIKFGEDESTNRD